MRNAHPGFSMLGLLITMVCIVVLMVILLNSINTAVTGSGSALPNTVASLRDKESLRMLHQAMFAAATEHRRGYITPSEIARGDDPTLNTTDNLFSAMIHGNYTTPRQLLSENEYNPNVRVDDDYNFYAHNPSLNVYWDEDFKADLEEHSNVSFAHMPLYGQRYELHWQQAGTSSRMPLLGNRGPADGEPSLSSWTTGRNGKWGGHFVFGDGHVDFFRSFEIPGRSVQQDGQTKPDNVFAVQTGRDGDDAIISFTKIMRRDGFELQFD